MMKFACRLKKSNQPPGVRLFVDDADMMNILYPKVRRSIRRGLMAHPRFGQHRQMYQVTWYMLLVAADMCRGNELLPLEIDHLNTIVIELPRFAAALI